MRRFCAKKLLATKRMRQKKNKNFFCPGLDSNPGPFVSLTVALPTPPPRLLYAKRQKNKLYKYSWLSACAKLRKILVIFFAQLSHARDCAKHLKKYIFFGKPTPWSPYESDLPKKIAGFLSLQKNYLHFLRETAACVDAYANSAPFI